MKSKEEHEIYGCEYVPDFVLAEHELHAKLRFYSALVAVILGIFVAVYYARLDCHTPRHLYKYQIWVYAPISVPHHCDSFKHVGNTWDLYVSGNLVESITTVQTVTVEPDPND